MTMKFPTQFTDSRAFDIARALLEGFDRHYRLFRATSAAAKTRFETADWHGQQRAQRERIEYYDRRVDEAVERLQREFDINHLSMDSWQQAKLHYIGLLTNHHQPELAETFFNSVTTKILHRDYFRNDFIFVRPAVSTEYIENDEPASLPTYRAYYPTRDSLRESLLRMINNCQLERAFEDLGRDVDQVVAALRAHTGEVRLRTNYQVQVLSSLFFRNKGAYVVGKIVNGFNETPFALPILHTAGGELAIDAALFGEDDLLMLFSFARAYFMVDMEIPSAYVQFLRSLMPRKPRSEIYSALGLQKQGKNLFYRDFLYHLRHSSDAFRVAPGIKGMVMLVFDLPSFPFVFKVIKDFYPPQKDTTRELIQLREKEPARPYAELVWLQTILKGTGRLAGHLDPGGTYRLKGRVSAEAEFRDHGSIVTFMETPARLNEIAADAGTSMDAVFNLVNAYDAIGLIEWTPRQRRHDPLPSSSDKKPGLLGKLGQAARRVITGESLFITVFSHQGAATGGKARVAFAAPYAGKIIPMKLSDMGGRIIAQRDSFLCAARGVSIGIYASILFVLDMTDRLSVLADPGQDRVGLALEEERLPKRIRQPRTD